MAPQVSPRPNTSALDLTEQVPEPEKSRRLRLLQERQRATQIRRNATLVGSEQEVLVERFNRATREFRLVGPGGKVVREGF